MINFFLGSAPAGAIPQGSGEITAAGSLTSEGDNLNDISAWIYAYYSTTTLE